MPSMPPLPAETCFTYETLAVFCGRSVDVVKDWKEKRLITYAKIGGRVTFELEDVAEFRARHESHARGFAPGERKQFWIEKARQFLGIHVAETGVRNEIQKLKDRQDALDARMTLKFGGAADSSPVKANGTHIPVESAAAPEIQHKEAA